MMNSSHTNKSSPATATAKTDNEDHSPGAALLSALSSSPYPPFTPSTIINTNNAASGDDSLLHTKSLHRNVGVDNDESNPPCLTCAKINKKHNFSLSSIATPPPISGRGRSFSLAHDITKQGAQVIELQNTLITSVQEIGKEIHSLSRGDIATKTYERVQKIRRLDRLSSERYIALKDLKGDWTSKEEKSLAKARLEELDALKVNFIPELSKTGVDSCLD